MRCQHDWPDRHPSPCAFVDVFVDRTDPDASIGGGMILQVGIGTVPANPSSAAADGGGIWVRPPQSLPIPANVLRATGLCAENVTASQCRPEDRASAQTVHHGSGIHARGHDPVRTNVMAG